EKSIKIDSLAPYSKYRINVWAITTEIGIGEKFEFKTMQTEKPTEREFPAASFTESTESLFVKFQWNCTILEGSVNFDANLACKSSWCFNETARKSSTSFTQPKDSFTFGTIGYTDYELTMFISRNSNQISKTIPFRTPPTAPGIMRNITVYTKNVTSVSLRWLPPYPPKGEIDYYTIKYFDTTYKYVIVDRTSKCKIWQEQTCHTFTVSSTNVYINVWAKNINVTKN
ncbi:Fibronectin domain-containing protein, partial [Oryctes borbonicus]